MDEKTTKMIKERFDALPKMVQDAITSSDYENLLIEIGKKYQLTVGQMSALEQETTLTMMGLTALIDFEEEITRELNVDKTKGAQIVKDINEKIFLNIRELLKLMNTPIGEEPVVDEKEELPNNIGIKITPSETKETAKETEILKSANIEITPEKPRIEIKLDAANEIENNKDNTQANINDMLSKIENPELIVTKPAIIIPPQPLMASQKLSGPFKIPATKTEYSLNNISKQNTVSQNPLPTNTIDIKPKVDPYREIPE